MRRHLPYELNLKMELFLPNQSMDFKKQTQLRAWAVEKICKG